MRPDAVTCYSQLDDRWANRMLAAGPYTIGQAGCLVSAVASGLCDLLIPHTPFTLDAWLKSNGGYDGSLYRWYSIGPLGAELLGMVNCPDDPAPLERIRAWLASGAIVVVRVDADVKTRVIDEHWVRLLTLDLDDRDGRIMDPWQQPGHELIRLSEHYEAAGWDAARAIMSVAGYRGAGA